MPPPELGRSLKINSKEDIEDSDGAWTAEDQDRRSSTRPGVYASGADMRFGVRVAAGYGDHVVLFSVPPDVFNGSKRTTGPFDQRMNSETAQSDETTDPQAIVDDSGESWEPVNVNGYYVDTVPRLIDLAVDSGPNMTLYAFSAKGQVSVYQLEKTNATVGVGPQPARMVSRRNGEIVHAQGKLGCGEWNQVDATLDGEVGDEGAPVPAVHTPKRGGVIAYQSRHELQNGVEYGYGNGCRVDYFLNCWTSVPADDLDNDNLRK